MRSLQPPLPTGSCLTACHSTLEPPTKQAGCSSALTLSSTDTALFSVQKCICVDIHSGLNWSDLHELDILCRIFTYCTTVGCYLTSILSDSSMEGIRVPHPRNRTKQGSQFLVWWQIEMTTESQRLSLLCCTCSRSFLTYHSFLVPYFYTCRTPPSACISTIK